MARKSTALMPPNRVQFKLAAKWAFKSVMELEGKPFFVDKITNADLLKIPEVEAFLEKFLGYRFHLLTMREWRIEDDSSGKDVKHGSNKA